MDMADAMVEGGWVELGYDWINIDDCWADLKGRDKTTKQLVADPKRFPNGMKKLGEYIHGKGLKYGIYSDVGELTCAKYPASLGYYELDAKTFAEWGVDSLKFDGCNLEPNRLNEAFSAMRVALKNAGRPMAFICVFGPYTKGNFDHMLASENCNQWRNYDDIDDSFQSLTTTLDWFADNQNKTIPAAKPGAWNDPDMLLVGGYGLTHGQSKIQMALWSIMASPLLMGNDLRHLKGQDRAILMNKEIIKVNQDILGEQGKRIAYDSKNIEIWTRTLDGGDMAVAIVHRHVAEPYFPYDVHVQLSDLSWASNRAYVRDLYQHKNMGLVKNYVKVAMEPLNCVMLRISNQPFASDQASATFKAPRKIKESSSLVGTLIWIAVIGILLIVLLCLLRMCRRQQYQQV